MSNPENSKSTKPAASGPAEHVSLAYLIYAVCYLLGARIIRYCRRSRRVLRKTCLHLKWKIRSAYLDIREQRAAASITQKSWKYEWKVAFDRTFQALQEWKRRRQQSGKLHPLAFLKAIAPAAKMMTRAVNYLLPIAAMVVLTLTVQHFGTLRYGLRVEYNGEHIGYILSESAFTEAEAKVRQRIVNEAYLPPEDSVPIYSLEVVQDDQISGEDILINNIIRASGNEIAEGAGLYVDDEFIGAVSDGDELLLSLKSRRDGTYQPGVPVSELQPAEEETTQPEETTEPEEATEPAETTPPEETTEPEESTEEPQSSPAQTHVIQEGDSLWDIAMEYGVSVETLTELNPDVSQTMLVGDTLIISHEQPFLQTQMVRTVTEEREIPYTTETEVDHNKESTYEEVVQEGQNGLEEVVSQITYIDGYETERTVLSETTVVEPVNAKIVVGSLTSTQYNFSGSGTPSTESNVGGYIWPVNGGYITCPIWGYYNHTGTDIAADAGTTIWASKAGTVIYAGWSNGYGYNVLISHPDGTKTRYAHCSELATYVGQQVSQGQVIAYVGRTGNASGDHCHFEIISSSGAFLDARDYIGYSY